MSMTSEENQKKLNNNLNSLISDNDGHGIPFVDEENFSDYLEHNGDSRSINSDSDGGIIISRKPSLLERRNTENLKLSIPKKENTNSNGDVHREVNVQIVNSPHASESNEHPGPLIEIQPGGLRTLRRNSFSLPVGLDSMDMVKLQQSHQTAVNHNNNDCAISMIHHDDNESMICSLDERDSLHQEEEYRKPMLKVKSTSFRSKRRLSVAPLPALRLNDKEMMANEFDSQSMISNQNSITSISSLASLLKEKMQYFPSMIKRKKQSTEDFKIKAFVMMLFLVIVFLVGYAYIFYHQKILARSYFDYVKFNRAKRILRVFDSKGVEIITGKLGLTINSETPYECLNQNIKNDGSVCIEWTERARMYLHFEDLSTSVRCYKIKWEALADGVHPTDCFDVSEEMGYWYGGGVTKNGEWPLERASFDFAPFVTGDTNAHQWGNVVKRYFINSRGVALTVDDKVPLHVSMNHNGSNKFCFKAMHDNFAYVNRLTRLPELNYKLCIGDDMKSLHTQMTQQSLWDGVNKEDVDIVRSLLDEPVWQIPASNAKDLTEASIFNYTEKVIALSFLKLGHVLVNEFWQKNIGDFHLDTERFQTLESTITMLHRRGFRISLSVQPFISTESKNFGNAVEKKLLIYERSSERSIPALTRFKSTKSAGVLDVTNPESIPWFLGQLANITKSYAVDSFFLDFGTAYNMPLYYQCSIPLDNPDHYKKIFVSQVEENLKMIGVTSVTTVPRPPAFLAMPAVNSSWDGLRSIITTVLSLGVIGYPFILPGPVGGDFILHKNKTNMASTYAVEIPPLPDQELYIRWFQIATFLPVLRFTHLPSEYETEIVNEVSKELAMIREKVVTPALEKYLSDAMNEAIPLIRPLWMLDPTDSACLTVKDEFSIGEEVIVAPILYKGKIQREVYLPQGVWKDGIDGSLRKGSRWIHNYRVPEDKVAYFSKMPDDTRF